MKKIFTVFLLLTLCLQSFAATGGADDLARAFDDYQYAVTVDWDQKDQASLKAITEAFYSRIDKLSQENGTTAAGLEKLIDQKVKDPAVLAALRVKIQLLGKNATREQVLEMLKNESKNLYQNGASWNGEAVMTYSLIIVVAALFAYAIYFELTHECVKWEEDPDSFDCRPKQYYTCSRFSECGYIEGPVECGYDTVCTEYVKK